MASVHRIRAAAIDEMRQICFTHIPLVALLMWLRLWIGHAELISFISFCNTTCLVERCWEVQLRTMIYWPIQTQGVFLVSRLCTVTCAILMLAFWMRIWLMG